MNDFCDSINTGITVAAPHPLIKMPVMSATVTRWRASHACTFSPHPPPPPIPLLKEARGKESEKLIACCVPLIASLRDYAIIMLKERTYGRNCPFSVPCDIRKE